MAAITARIDVGRRLAAERQRKGVTQATVARRAGLAAEYLSRIETGRVQPTFRTVLRVAEALDVGLDRIVCPSTPRQPDPCPVSGGACMLELVRSEAVIRRGERGASFTPKELRLLRRVADWIRTAPRDRVRALEILMEDLMPVRR